MDVERIIDEIEQLEEMFEAPDIRPLSAAWRAAQRERAEGGGEEAKRIGRLP